MLILCWKISKDLVDIGRLVAYLFGFFSFKEHNTTKEEVKYNLTIFSDYNSESKSAALLIWILVIHNSTSSFQSQDTFLWKRLQFVLRIP